MLLKVIRYHECTAKHAGGQLNTVVVGGGAAGFFGAIAAAESGRRVTLLESGSSVLSKVKISGGGRCNVTHACFEPRELVTHYPRGGKALWGSFARFQPSDTVDWFARRGVPTKTEADGRMFPTTDDSQTIVDCLVRRAKDVGVHVQTQTKVSRIIRDGACFEVHAQQRLDRQGRPISTDLADSPSLQAQRILLATGGSRDGFELARRLGHSIVPPVPSLFTFNVNDHRIKRLQGIAVDEVECRLVTPSGSFQQSGALLITHWGMSGPAVLRLSAWAARELFENQYRATLRVNWLAGKTHARIREDLIRAKVEHAKKNVDSICPWALPKRLWKALSDHVLIGSNGTVRWAEVSNKLIEALARELSAGEFQVDGKGVFKDEFVTCGGVELKEVDFRTMESRVCPGLYLAGEILDVDGVTGGFNFQNAWTTGWIAGNSI